MKPQEGVVSLGAVLFLCGALAVQRFTLGYASAFVCLVPLLLALCLWLARQAGAAMSCLLVALLLSVDNGGGVYPETPSAIRYLIYVSVFLVLVGTSISRLRPRMAVLAGLACAGIVLGTLSNVSAGAAVFDILTLRRDAIVLVVLATGLFVRSGATLDPMLVYAGGLGYLAGELGNVLLFYRLDTDYLSYDSLKAFVVFPLFFALMTRQSRLWQLMLAAATLPIVFLYGSRMITLSLLALVLMVPFIRSIRGGKLVLGLGLVIVAGLLASVDVAGLLASDALVRAKALSFFVVLIQNFDAADIASMFAALDPVRFAEHQLFFSRSPLEVLLGSGLGSGITDTQGALGFVSYDQTAFSPEEIRTSTYFNLHDFWIDYGLRFGLLPVIVLVFTLTTYQMWRGRPWLGVLFGVVLLNTTFATSGLLLMALLVRCFPRDLEMREQCR